ncbi:MAG: hypothetical protein Ct9H90mP25_2540 [Gammaproteobacteria bacterium]|nr:MAG: hypothetical protein Ct9H90mP25_2540 [Gammaproteobacteria bacterium]
MKSRILLQQMLAVAREAYEEKEERMGFPFFIKKH